MNGAQSFYKTQFGIGDKNSERDSWLVGLVNSAPYLCCAFIGCWLTEPMNARFGRRGTVFIACVISALACLWQGFTSKYIVAVLGDLAETDFLLDTWWHMFIARFALGLGIGPKSATTREYRTARMYAQNADDLKPSLLPSVLRPRLEGLWLCSGRCGPPLVS